MAHKLMAVVTRTGSVYDSQGGVHEWWTASTGDAYANYTQCLARQYNASLSFGQATSVSAFNVTAPSECNGPPGMTEQEPK